MIEQDISDSNADVLVRVEPEGYNDGVICTVYNTTNGTDYCSKYSTKINPPSCFNIIVLIKPSLLGILRSSKICTNTGRIHRE